MKRTYISVVIPVKELSYYLLFENLPAFDKQTYDSFEVIVLPNTQGLYDLTLLKKYPWLKIVPTGKITRPAEKRDIGVEHAKGELVAFIDDDAYPAANWLEKANSIYNHEKKDASLAAVCGPGTLPEITNREEKIFDLVLCSALGSGKYTYRFQPETKRFVDDYPSMNFFVEKAIFKSLGGFNSKYWPGEDSKLCNDLIYKKKRKILYHPDVTVYHHRRNNMFPFLKQQGSYGFHRGAFFAHGDKNSKQYHYLVPALFVVYLLFLPIFILIFWKINLILPFIPLFVYAMLLSFHFIFFVFLKDEITAPLLSSAMIFLTHIYYGIMFIRGYFIGYVKKENIYKKGVV